MKIKIGIAVLLLLIQFINGYALNETKLYTPVFTYFLITGIVIFGVAAIIVWQLCVVCGKSP